MLKKKIKYTDYNGVEREEEFLFNLSKAELMEMQMSTNGGLDEMIAALVKTQNMPEIIRIFKEIILKAYGEKSLDGKRFIKVDEKGNALSVAFSQTEAFSNLFMELATDSKAAASFVNGVIPKDMEVSEEQQRKFTEELLGTSVAEAAAVEAASDLALPENTQAQ